MVVDDEPATVITAREANPLVLVDPEITADGLRDRTRPPAARRAYADRRDQMPVELWDSRLTAGRPARGRRVVQQGAGRPARLVHLDDPTRRPTSPAFSEPDDRVSFADGYPLLVATEASLAALNDVVVERSEGAHPPLPMTRFRPNVVIAGAEAWAEDDWRRIRIGDAVFRAVKGCARCVITTIDPDTAVREKEPIASLARIRRWDGATWFGVNLVPDTAGVTIRVGDEVEVLDAVAPGAGPIRPAV